jgi:hypothetical protein
MKFNLRSGALVTLGSVVMFVMGTATADVVSEPAKIGANAGAMKYCKDKADPGDDRGKYNLLAIEAAKRYDDLDRDEKRRALVTRKAAEDGDYLGDPLTENPCESLRKILFVEYN